MDRTLEEPAAIAKTGSNPALIQPTHNLEFDLCQAKHILAKVRSSRVYAQNLYAALCNNKFQEQHVFEILKDRTWSCTWRYASGVIADMRGEGDYMDWYCSGMGRSHPDDDLGTGHPIETGYVGEGTITPEILADFASIGWRPIEVDQ